ncbi:MAG TPA: hypothetical protein VEK15_31290, partial [Vicinamibacteria bacterium]|nr:hypothetical protein [Vicinamibacteria bacterium]
MPGAHEYTIYRYVFPGGIFFYPTQVQPASAGTTYVEAGDLDPNSFEQTDPPTLTPVDPNEDCPTRHEWNNGYFPWGSEDKSCDTFFLQAFYVTARGSDDGITASGGESPRSEIIFWNCSASPGYAKRGSPRELEWIADAGAGEPTCEVEAESTADPAAVCDTGESWASASMPPASADDRWRPATSPLLFLGTEVSPSFSVFNMHVDHLGSTRLVTDLSGETISE